mmetsp:Transcript_8379/g.9755  ORF Transcript_8379/g.9755 Transcript_8379/m.9755 type:complete len:430 (-) Transcript_8379:235-1524(-)|eukprot:CAMPEP_0170765784 /NCGR_PEP_ID=MMETSP0733-20121128/4800_1 /TAXON_ID=186038 /ORGANISM="Fragilariopsis kerguelensis, Strain L26-C5" /LENGTH=429 /DNA_ID=CAMNT_0011106679 /DNA_START=7 /DNA_END=1296 /DNA_ORIENTATION=-
MTTNSTTISFVNDNDNEYRLINDKKRSSNVLGRALCCASCLGVFNVESGGNETPFIRGTSFDVIVVEGRNGKLFQNSDFLVSFKGKNKNEDDTHRIVMELEQENPDISGTTTKAWFPIQPQHSTVDSDNDNEGFDVKRFWDCCHPMADNAKPNMMHDLYDGRDECDQDTSFALKAFLKPGRNNMRYLLLDDQQIIGVAYAYIFLLKHNDTIAISDIDGTITKSNIRGVLGTIVTRQYERVCHVGICHLLSGLSSSSQVVYVTSRPISLASQTRHFLSNLRQGNITLPQGPLLGFEGNMSQLFMMEKISKTTQKFKAEKLSKQVIQPFRSATNDLKSPFFVIGIGNTMMDVQAYHAIGMDLNRIYMINKKSHIISFEGASTFEREDGDSDGDGILSFPPQQWYKGRIGAKFNGYTDPKLLSQLGINTDMK